MTGDAQRDGPYSGAGISIIIPTWNEAPWLPFILTGVAGHPAVGQVVVADNRSDDRSVEIARDARCRVVDGGLPGPARNRGASVATQPLLVFADADVALDHRVLDTIAEQFTSSTVQAVVFELEPLSDKRFVRCCYAAHNRAARLASLFERTRASAPLIAVRQAAFAAVGGFDEAIAVAEDVDFIRRVQRDVGGVVLCPGIKLKVSARRFEIERPVAYAARCVAWGLLRLLGSRRSFTPYRWQVYPEVLATQETWLRTSAVRP